MTSNEWIALFNLSCLAYFVFGVPRLEKRRYMKWREEVVRGIIADLKKSETTLVIKETQEYMNKAGHT